MNEKIRHILDQIRALDEELHIALHEQEGKLRYTIEGRRVAFEQSIREAHARLKTGSLRWFLGVRPQNLLTAPIIYSMILPLLFADLCVSVYQATCFPIYGIAKCRRQDYIVFDHQHLAYLNIFEKFHCLYCSYANGVLAYAREITARTEQYFCPIKHAHKVLHAHERYAYFLDYGAAENYQNKVEEFRAELARERMENKTRTQ